MGKIRIKTLGLDEMEKAEKEKAKVRRDEKKKREGVEVKPVREDKKEKVKTPGGKGGERSKQVEVSAEEVAKMEKAKKLIESDEVKPHSAKASRDNVKKTAGKKRVHGRKYSAAKIKVKKNTKYKISEAVALLKTLKFTKFDETVELHLNLVESGVKGEVSLPKPFGKAVRVAIADDAILAKIDKNQIEFDVLIAAPSFMPKLVKYAKVLGPKGLMPNAKAGTVSDKPEEAAKKFTSGSLRFKSEAKFPLLHQAVGKISFGEKELVDNISTFLKAVPSSKIRAAFLKSTMSPSIRIEL